MSNAFAMAAVTTVLKDLLNDGLIDNDLASTLGNVTVTALPPDRISASNGEERSQLNLFLYQVTSNTGWSNTALPSRSRDGERLTNPPLALDLHYLLSAHGQQDTHAEALLGFGMQLMHETPMLSRADIVRSLRPTLPNGVTLPPGLDMLASSDLAEQVELIKISPHYLNLEELSKLWTAFQAKYRPCMAYHVSVVLIEGVKPVRSPLPVLTRGPEDRGPSAQGDVVPRFPTIDRIQLPNNQTSILPGNLVELIGHDFTRIAVPPSNDTALVDMSVVLDSLRLTAPMHIPIDGANGSVLTDASIKFVLPAMPAGPCTLSLQVTPKSAPDQRIETSEIALSLAPRIDSINGIALNPGPVSVARDGSGKLSLTLVSAPAVLLEQRVSLIVGSRQVNAKPRTLLTDPLTFDLENILPGDYRVRLRVDGVDSLLINRASRNRPAFDETQKIKVT